MKLQLHRIVPLALFSVLGQCGAGSASTSPDATSTTAADSIAVDTAKSDSASTTQTAVTDSATPTDSQAGDTFVADTGVVTDTAVADTGVVTDSSKPSDTGVVTDTAVADTQKPADTAPPGPVVAFPGAVGVGRNATGGRGGCVLHVTTLADSGTGSFRDAVSHSKCIIVFDVGGYINLQTAVSVGSNLTIAGQTAPGGGIGIMGRETSFSNSSNDIVRNMRFRQGDLDTDNTKSGINLLDTTNMIFDHVSIEFAQWNNIDAVGASNITIQFSITADPIGQQFAAHTETGPYTWYNCIFANAHNRNPLAKDNTVYINNVVYNFQAGYTAGNSAGVFTHDIVNNYFISGPKTTNSGDAFYQMNTQQVYAAGNYLDSNNDGTLNGAVMGQPGGTTTLTKPWSTDTTTIATVSAAAAYANVIVHSGALPHDQVDQLVINDVSSLGKTGDLWTSQTATGLANSGYGTIAGGTAPTDTDGDGMPDTWETKYGLNPNDPSDATGDFDHTGYTNIEKYINGLLDGSYPD